MMDEARLADLRESLVDANTETLAQLAPDLLLAVSELQAAMGYSPPPARSAQYLLESLTPGGSEYHNNPKRCAEWIETRLSEAQRLTMQAYKQRNEARDELDALRVENARLREAMWPLIRFAENHVKMAYRVADVPEVLDSRELKTARAAALEAEHG